MEEMMKFVVEKMKEAPLALENLGVEAKAGLDKVSPLETRRDIINHWKVATENAGGEALVWFDEVFPPETRADKINHWFHVARPYLIAALVLTVVVWICRQCCCGGGRWVVKVMKAPVDWIRRGSCSDGRWVKMMKAPGRNYMMPRHIFESNPKGYFFGPPCTQMMGVDVWFWIYGILSFSV